MVSINERPNFWLDSGSSGGYPWDKVNGVEVPNNSTSRSSPGDGPAGSPLLADRGFWAPDNAHQPSLAYVPYLITGDRYYADEVSAWADYGLLATFESHAYMPRAAARAAHSNETRGFAWVLRNIGDAAAYLPDNDVMKAYLTQKLQNNLTWLDNFATTTPAPLGVAWLSTRPGPGGDGSSTADPSTQVGVALWAHQYLAWAIDHVNLQGFAGGLLERDQIARFTISLFNSPDYDPAYGAPYVLGIAAMTPQGTNYYTTLKQVFANTYPAGSTPVQFRGYYGPEARLMAMIGLKNGWAGAQYAYNYINPQVANSGPYYSSDFDAHPGWAIAANGGVD